MKYAVALLIGAVFGGVVAWLAPYSGIDAATMSLCFGAGLIGTIVANVIDDVQH